MPKPYLLLFPVLCCLLTGSFFAAQAQQYDELGENRGYLALHNMYLSNGFETGILSSGLLTRPGVYGREAESNHLTTPRFTLFVNFGVNLNYEFSRSVAVFTGLSLKNIGFVENFSDPDSSVTRRVYSLGAPLGLRFGNLDTRNYGFLGVGADLPFHYKEKSMVAKNTKQKHTEFFSGRTARVLPYLFAGVSVSPGIVFKAAYYPTNFLNPDYKTTIGGVQNQPFAGYDVHLLYLSVGLDIQYRRLYRTR